MGSPGYADDTPGAPDLSTTSPLLELDHVTLSLPIADELRTILQDVSLTIDRGESVGLVGESGSGKSISARTIMRLLPRGAKIGGQVRFSGRSVLEFDRGELRSYHASQVAMIYQDPRAHINRFAHHRGLPDGGSAVHDQDLQREGTRACGDPTAGRRNL